MSGRRRPRTTRAGEGQLSLLAGILTETDRAVLELARGPGLAARVAAQAQHLLGTSPTRYSSCSVGCWTGLKPPTPNVSWSPGCGRCATNTAGCVTDRSY